MSVIKIENISKKYANIEKYDVTFRERVISFLSSANKRRKKNFSMLALDNISFKIDKGEKVGIIGLNGAGKSTLLKVLSKITTPSSGRVIINGKVSSLLEIGSGFHAELTGLENIYLNGAVMGMKKKDIDEKKNEIIEFSGIGKYINIPIKKYSSGMKVKLAFAVASSLVSDILMLDEVLAVGDIKFQKKCLEKMNEIAGEKKKTIIFVSHDLGYIGSLCDRCIWLENGRVLMDGDANKVIEKYVKHQILRKDNGALVRDQRRFPAKVEITDIDIVNADNISELIKSGDKMQILVNYISEYKESLDNFRVVIKIHDKFDVPLVRFDTRLTKDELLNIKSKGKIICNTDNLDLAAGQYFISVMFFVNNKIEDMITSFVLPIYANLDKYNFNIDDGFSLILNKHSFAQE